MSCPFPILKASTDTDADILSIGVYVSAGVPQTNPANSALFTTGIACLSVLCYRLWRNDILEDAAMSHIHRDNVHDNDAPAPPYSAHPSDEELAARLHFLEADVVSAPALANIGKTATAPPMTHPEFHSSDTPLQQLQQQQFPSWLQSDAGSSRRLNKTSSLDSLIRGATLEAKLQDSRIQEIERTIERIVENPHVEPLLILTEETTIKAQSSIRVTSRLTTTTASPGSSITWGEMRHRRWRAEQEQLMRDRVARYEEYLRWKEDHARLHHKQPSSS
ncbi:hypothetical protein RI367_006489 [Sorochytrium milnesiophthora]